MRYCFLRGLPRALPRAIGIALFLSSAIATAQISPGMGGGGMGPGGGFGGGGSSPGGQTPSGDEKKEGVAEAAPKTPASMPTTAALPTPKAKSKRLRLIEFDGYYRTRTDWFYNFNLGFNDQAIGGAPFPRAIGCGVDTTTTTVANTNAPCNSSLASTNMRLRLDPTINIDEGTAVHIQADALDNILFGSTPVDNTYSGNYASGLAPPLGSFSSTQGVVTQGVNSDRPSIAVKRAWGEVALPIGVLQFGRMPNQWGMGIYHNAGGYDPATGLTNYDADYGDTVDRVSFTASIPGTCSGSAPSSCLRAMFALDWDSVSLTSNDTALNTVYSGHPFDLDDSDDRNGFVGVISKMDTPQDFRDQVDRGDLALNYGLYFEYKTQDWDENLADFQLGGPISATTGGFNATTSYLPRSLKTYSPDLWFKLGYGRLLIESELVGVLGYVSRLDQVGEINGANIRKYGGTGRLTERLYDNKLRIGIETGFATGDQYDNSVQGQTNIAYSNPLGGPGDTSLSQFIFNRDYQVDLIMWRYLFGAVTNALYFKPFIQFDITKAITLKISNVTSFALRPVATPGNSAVYGTEFDTDVGYSQNGVYAGISFGALFPFGAMSHPAEDPTQGGAGFNYGTNTGDPGSAYTIQTRLVLAF